MRGGRGEETGGPGEVGLPWNAPGEKMHPHWFGALC